MTKSTLVECFIPPKIAQADDIPILAKVHRKRKNGENFEVIKTGFVFVKADSIAEEAMKKLPYGCGSIDFIPIGDSLYCGFRDNAIFAISEYVEIMGNHNVNNFLKGVSI